MMAVLGMLVFASALAASGAVFAFTLVPALPRIVALLRSGVDPLLTAQPVLNLNDRRPRARIRPMTPVRIQSYRAAA